MLRLIRDLLPLRVSDAALTATVEAWVGGVRTAYEERNRVLHSVWIGDGQSAKHWRVDLRPLGGQREERDASDILSAARRLEELATTRASFLGDLACHVGGPWSVSPL